MNRDYDLLRIVNEVPHLRMASHHHHRRRRCTLNTSPDRNNKMPDSQALQQQPSEQPLDKASTVGSSTWFKAPMQKPYASKQEDLGARDDYSIGGWFSLKKEKTPPRS